MSRDLFSVGGKKAVVTGGSRGIGRMIASALADGGAEVVISSRKAEDLRATAEEIGATALPADLSTPEGCTDLAAAVAERWDTVDVLVNNAGAAWGEPIDTYPATGWDRVLDINVKGVFLLTQALLPQLRASQADGGASVINIGSIEGMSVPAWENYAYPASKAAVHMLTRHLAKFLVGDGIRVNAIAPGLFPSRMTAFVTGTDEARAEIVKHIPMGRVGEPDDMAGVSLFLASRASAFMTGAVIPVDGGTATTR